MIKNRDVKVNKYFFNKLIYFLFSVTKKMFIYNIIFIYIGCHYKCKNCTKYNECITCADINRDAS